MESKTNQKEPLQSPDEFSDDDLFGDSAGGTLDGSNRIGGGGGADERAKYDAGEFDLGDGDDDDDFDMDDSYHASDSGAGGGGGGNETKSSDRVVVQKVDNDHFDEAIDLDASLSGESIDTHEATSPKVRQVERDSPPNTSGSMRSKGGDLSEPDMDGEESRDNFSERKMGDTNGNGGVESKTAATGGATGSSEAGSGGGESDDEVGSPGQLSRRFTGKLGEMADNIEMADKAKNKLAAAMASPKSSVSGASDTEDEDSSSNMSARGGTGASGGGAGGAGMANIKGGYNPSDYAHLSVSEEVQELFQYITRFKPHNIDLDTKLKTFIPEFIPAIGETDAFIKVPRPDQKADELGLKVLDEPGPEQSDATVLDLQLRAISKKSNLEPMVVRSIENADKNPKAVAGWIKSIIELHKSKPPPQVTYTKAMPDIESLMQVWPEDVEQLLRDVTLPPADIDLDLKDYARVVCALLDIPVYNSMTESLHVLFTLYSEFSNNQHFRNTGGGGPEEGAGGGMRGAPRFGTPQSNSTAGLRTGSRGASQQSGRSRESTGFGM